MEEVKLSTEELRKINVQKRQIAAEKYALERIAAARKVNVAQKQVLQVESQRAQMDRRQREEELAIEAERQKENARQIELKRTQALQELIKEQNRQEVIRINALRKQHQQDVFDKTNDKQKVVKSAKQKPLKSRSEIEFKREKALELRKLREQKALYSILNQEKEEIQNESRLKQSNIETSRVKQAEKTAAIKPENLSEGLRVVAGLTGHITQFSAEQASKVSLSADRKNDALKQQALELKERYERERSDKAHEKYGNKQLKQQILQAKEQQRMQKRQEYAQQQEADAQIDLIRYQNLQERQKLATKHLLSLIKPQNQ